MPGTLGSLVVDIGADVARLRRDMGEAQKTVGNASKRIQTLAKRASNALSGIAGTLAGAFAVRGFSRFITNTANATDEVGKLATRLGVTTEAVSRLQFVASQSGIAFDTVRGSLERLGKRAALAAAGQKSFADAFALVGLNAKEFVDLPLDEQLVIVAEAVDRAQGSSQKLAAVSRILGDESRALVQAFDDGADGIRRLYAEADELGTVTADQARIAAEFNDEWDKTRRVLEDVARDVAIKLLPPLRDIAVVIRENTQPALEFFSRAANNVREQVLAGASAVASFGSAILKFLATPVIGSPDDPVTLKLQSWSEDLDQVAKNAEAAAEKFRDINEQDELRTQAQDLGAPLQPRVPPPALPSSLFRDRSRQTEITKAAKAQERLNEQARQTIERLTQQTETLGFSNEQLTVYNANVLAAKLGNEELAEQLIATAKSAAEASEEFTAMENLKAEAEALRESLRTPFDEAFDALDRYDLLLEKNLITNDEWAKATNAALDRATETTEEVEEEIEKVNEAWGQAGTTFRSAFDSAIEEGAKLSDVLKGLERDLINILKQQVGKGLQQQLAGFFGTSGGTTGTGVGAGFASFLSSFFGGDAQFGRRTRPDRFYRVGEAGPELFAPGASGQIIPAGDFSLGNTTQQFDISISGVGDNVSTESASQFATRVAQQLQNRLRRNS